MNINECFTILHEYYTKYGRESLVDIALQYNPKYKHIISGSISGERFLFIVNSAGRIYEKTNYNIDLNDIDDRLQIAKHCERILKVKKILH